MGFTFSVDKMSRAKSWPITSLKSREEKVWSLSSNSAFVSIARFLAECCNNLTMSCYVWRSREINKLILHALIMRVSLNEIYASSTADLMWKQRTMSSKRNLTQGLIRRFQRQLNGLAKVFFKWQCLIMAVIKAETCRTLWQL